MLAVLRTEAGVAETETMRASIEKSHSFATYAETSLPTFVNDRSRCESFGRAIVEVKVLHITSVNQDEENTHTALSPRVGSEPWLDLRVGMGAVRPGRAEAHARTDARHLNALVDGRCRRVSAVSKT